MNGKAALLTLVLIYLHRRHVALLVAWFSIDRVLGVLRFCLANCSARMYLA
jgi:hypothetical protein